MYAPMPEAGTVDAEILAHMAVAQEIVNGVRGVRARKNISPKEVLPLLVLGKIDADTALFASKLANLGAITMDADKDAAAASFMVGTLEFNVPQTTAIDVEAEISRISKDIAYYEGFRESVNKKLGNERFVSKAPAAVVEAERKKLADAETKIAALKASLEALAK